tara:strand:+ start:3471 stop:3866 length:396 start_codon:yes stop_codon:yes gene_type:complete
MLKSKKAKSLLPKTAKECKVSEELATDVVDFYYTKLRKKIESLQDFRIGVPILGTFTVSKHKIKRSVDKLTKILTDGSPESFERIKKYKLTEEMRDMQQLLLNKIEKDEQEKDCRKKDMGLEKGNIRRYKE